MLRAALLLVLLAAPATAQTFPDRPIRMVVPFAVGSASDIGARLLAEALAAPLAQPVVVENRAGGAGMIGAEVVAHAPPDGHTLLFNSASHAALRVTVPNAPIDPIHDLTPVSILTELPMVMLVANGFPARDGREFIDVVRAAPRRYDYGSTGGGGALGMAAVLFLRATGLAIEEVPYRGGGPATIDLAAGRLAVVFDVALSGFQTARSGQARAFAVSGAARSPTAPDVPTWREIGVPAEMMVWQAVFVPAATPAPIRSALHAAIAAVQQSDAVRRRWLDLGVDRVLALPPDEAARYVAREVTRWEMLLASR